MVSISLDIPGEQDKLMRDYMALTTDAVERAEVRAVNKTARWFRTQLLRWVSRETRLPQKALKSRFNVPVTAKKNAPRAKVWAGLLGFDPMRLGLKGRRTAAGYRLGRFLFKGAFRAYYQRPFRGLGVIYKRKGRKRGPLARQYIPIETETKTAVERILPRANRELLKRLKQELNFELHKLAGTV